MQTLGDRLIFYVGTFVALALVDYWFDRDVVSALWAGVPAMIVVIVLDAIFKPGRKPKPDHDAE